MNRVKTKIGFLEVLTNTNNEILGIWHNRATPCEICGGNGSLSVCKELQSLIGHKYDAEAIYVTVSMILASKL